MPVVRFFAWSLGVAPATVTRAYDAQVWALKSAGSTITTKALIPHGCPDWQRDEWLLAQAQNLLKPGFQAVVTLRD